MGSGSIEGWVFNDANLNGALDQGETGVAGIKIKLEDGSTVTTDSKGHYQFPAVGAGKHVVNLEAKRIPAAYTFEGAETVAVEVKRRTGARADFAFVTGVSVRGRVLVSGKGAGKEAKGLADVLVLLKPGDLNTFTDSEGYFAFDGILPKNYEISLHPETLPEYGEVAPKTLNLTLKPGDKTQGIIFSVNQQERPIIFK